MANKSGFRTDRYHLCLCSRRHFQHELFYDVFCSLKSPRVYGTPIVVAESVYLVSLALCKSQTRWPKPPLTRTYKVTAYKCHFEHKKMYTYTKHLPHKVLVFVGQLGQCIALTPNQTLTPGAPWTPWRCRFHYSWRITWHSP